MLKVGRGSGLAEKLANRLDVRGFDEVQIKTGLISGLAIGFAAVAGHRHQLERTAPCGSAQLPRKLVTVHTRQPDVEERGVRLEAFRHSL